MASYFRQSRDTELSLIYYLTQSFTSDWTGITTVKTFKDIYAKDINLPIVCVRLADTNSTRREIGSSTLEDRYLIIIDIFARSDGQRLDLSDYVKSKLKDGWIHYEHSHASGDNTTLTRVANGRDWVVEFISDSKIDLGENTDTKDQFRQALSLRVRASI